MRKSESEPEKDRSERWLLTYSDMMNNLLILFMVLYAMSVMDMAKFKELAKQFNKILSDTPLESVEQVNLDNITVPEKTDKKNEADASSDTKSEPDEMDKFEKAYEMIKAKIKQSGYENLLILEKGDNYIKFRFSDKVLFYPDSPKIKEDNNGILKFIGDTIKDIDPLIQTIEIDGHTATTGGTTKSFFSWELSSQRSISVLKYLVLNCSLPESKMSISGYSRYRPVAKNDTEENRQLNRRVEIKITKVLDNSSGQK